MNDLQIFKSSEFGSIRTIDNNGKPLFCGSDIAKALGYAIPTKAVNTHCKGVSKMEAPTASGYQSMLFIPEGDVYRLIAHSKLPSAAQFERWVFDEVLPSLRQHGAYLTPAAMERVMNDPDAWITMLTTLKEERKQREQLARQVSDAQPKVRFADSVAASPNTILIGELAKILKGNGMNIGQNRLFSLLREEGYLIKSGRADYNCPTQYAMNLGLFEVQEITITKADGSTRVCRTTRVTGKGQQYFINRYLAREVS